MATGDLAEASLCPKSTICPAVGALSMALTNGASATDAVSTSMSSGKAITTGPGRPDIATWKARETTSGMRAGSSISVAHLAA